MIPHDRRTFQTRVVKATDVQSHFQFLTSPRFLGGKAGSALHLSLCASLAAKSLTLIGDAMQVQSTKSKPFTVRYERAMTGLLLSHSKFYLHDSTRASCL